jgi:hypothetical protein
MTRPCTGLSSGFTDIVIEPLDAISSASSPLIPAVAYCHGTPLRNEIDALETLGLDDATEHAALAIASCFGGSDVSGRIRAFAITAR